MKLVISQFVGTLLSRLTFSVTQSPADIYITVHLTSALRVPLVLPLSYNSAKGEQLTNYMPWSQIDKIDVLSTNTCVTWSQTWKPDNP